MFRKVSYTLSILILVVSTLFSGILSPFRPEVSGQLAPKAIGAIPGQGRHLVSPRTEVVKDVLTDEGLIRPDSSETDIQSAVDAYYQEFAKNSRTWASPETQLFAEQREQELAAGNETVQSIQPVSVKILVLPVQFSTTPEDVHYIERNYKTCTQKNETGTDGPSQGQITAPKGSDNNTLYYTPDQTSRPGFYDSLIFGTDGITEPVREIDLAGYTVQDYYDHVAGVGNVNLSGSVENWVAVNHSEAYYGAPGCITIDGGNVPLGTLVQDAVNAFNTANPGFDWQTYDGNSDGVVDSMWLIHAGEGQETGGGKQGEFAIWSQSTSMTADGMNQVLAYDGDGNPATPEDNIYIDPYTVLPENAGLGVMTEEFGHNVFGLPDLSTEDADNSIAFWSNMSNGSWTGPLAGSVPVGMPLWFKMIAQCGATPCNWQEPMNSIDYKQVSSSTSIKIGQLEVTPTGLSKGIRIELPEVVSTTDNPIPGGDGKAAWSGMGLDNSVITLDRTINVPASGPAVLSVDSSWIIEEGSETQRYDYATVQVSTNGGASWTYLDDGVHFIHLNPDDGIPYLTGEGSGTLSFDFSSYRGSPILRFEYHTDSMITDDGWFLDNLKLNGNLVSNFEDMGTAAWANSNPGFHVVPEVVSSPRYYLVEWRNKTKYDSMVQTAYVTQKDNIQNGWVVDRIPYNIPGALVYYRDSSLPTRETRIANSAFWYSPSMGPKLKLLVVDMNYSPMRYKDPSSDWYNLGPAVGSYDAALTMQNANEFTIHGLKSAQGELEYAYTYPAHNAETRFDDTLGYYAGRYYGSPCVASSQICDLDTYGSAVIPARGDYSLRISNFDSSPLPSLYGTMDDSWGWTLGDGNPGSNNVQYGVNIALTEKASDGTWGTIQLSNYSVDYAFSQKAFVSAGKFGISYTMTITNSGTETVTGMKISWRVSPSITLDKLQYGGAEIAIPSTQPYNLSGTLAPGASKTVTFNGYINNLSNPDLWIQLTPYDGKVDRGPWTVTTTLFKTAIPLVVK